MEKSRIGNVFCLFVVIAYISLGSAACARSQLKTSATPILFASCEIAPNESLDPELAKTNHVTGRVVARHELGKDIEIRLFAEGLDTNGSELHGFHIHEYGDLSDGCESTGSHFNPFNELHGGPDDEVRHVGDLGNVERDENGCINAEITDDLASLWGATSIYGRTFMIHADEDDLGDGGNEDSLTTGNAGSRLGCCVIGHATESVWQ